jgi:CheY-like chemotaxis protein
MALFGFGKDKKEGSGSIESVLAYLEDAQRLRAAFTLIGNKKMELTGSIQGIDEGSGLVTFQTAGTLMTEKGGKVTFIYLQEPLRLGATCVVAEVRPNTLILELPDNLELKERRGQPRARLNPKEGSTLTALTGLFEGVGITGVIENISETGARIKVEKAMNLKGEKRLPLGTSLVPVGQPFMLIKLNKLPKCPGVMELEGRAVYLDGAQGLALGIEFGKPRPDFGSALRGMVSSRTTSIPSSVPAKVRRRAVEAPASGNGADEESLLPTPRRSGPGMVEGKAPVAAANPAPAPEVAEPLQPAVPVPLAVSAPVPVAPPAPKNDALLRLKKRSRAVVALAPTAVFGDMLREFLQEEGYGRVLVTPAAEEFLEFLNQPNLGVVLLDGQLSALESLEFARKLKEAFPDLPPIVLAAEDVSTAIVMAAHRSGVAQLLVKPYDLDEALSELLATQMGI